MRVDLRLGNREEHQWTYQPQQEQAIAPGQSLVFPALDPANRDGGHSKDHQPLFKAIETISVVDQPSHVGLIGSGACQGVDIAATDCHEGQIRGLAEEAIGLLGQVAHLSDDLPAVLGFGDDVGDVQQAAQNRAEDQGLPKGNALVAPQTTEDLPQDQDRQEWKERQRCKMDLDQCHEGNNGGR